MSRFVPVALVLALVVGCNKRRQAEAEPDATPATPTTKAIATTQRAAPKATPTSRAAPRKAEPVAKKVEPPPALSVERVASAFLISDDFKQNEIAAKRDYQGKRFRIVGVVERVRLDRGKALVELKEGSLALFGIACEFDADDPEVERLGANVLVIIDGTGAGKRVLNPLFRDCVLKGAGYSTYELGMSAAEKMPR